MPHLQLAARTRPGEEFPEEYLGEAEAGLGHYALAAEAYQQAIQRGHGSEQALEAWAGFALERFRSVGVDLRSSAPGVAAARRLAEAAREPATGSGCGAAIPFLERRLASRQKGNKQVIADVETAFQLSSCYAAAAGEAAAKLEAPQEDLAAVHRLRGDVLLRLKGDAPAAEAEYRQALGLQSGDPALLEPLAEA